MHYDYYTWSLMTIHNTSTKEPKIHDDMTTHMKDPKFHDYTWHPPELAEAPWQYSKGP